MRRTIIGTYLIIALGILVAAGCAGSKQATVHKTPAAPPKAASAAKPAAPSERQPVTLYVTAEQVNLRECPALKCKALGTLKTGDQVIQLEQKDDWIKVRVKATNREGWLTFVLLGKNPPPKKTQAKPKPKPAPKPKAKKPEAGLQEEFSP